jgi:hypothetical protein
MIKKTETVTTQEQGKWSVVERQFISEQEFDKLDYDEKKKWERHNSDQFAKSIYGYPPVLQVISTEEIKVYEQVVNDLDLVAVIQAVNNRRF